MKISLRDRITRAGSGFRKALPMAVFLLSAGVTASCTGAKSLKTSALDLNLAPPPPRVFPTVIESASVRAPVELAKIETAAGYADVPMRDPVALSLERQSVKKDCSVKDRFDRKYILAYQWGQTGENQLGLDVDGIGFDGGEVEGIKLEYKMRLQPIKNKKEKCRYESGWQGMLGSGYNEFFLREHDTVWMHLEEFEDDLHDAFYVFFSE